MRSIPATALAIALVASSILLSSGLPARGASSLLIDEGFENGVGDWVADGGTLSTTTAFAHEGSHSAVFTSDSSGSGFIRYAPTPIQPAAEYQFTAFLLKNDAQIGLIQLQIRWLDADGQSLQPNPSEHR